mmetsp:Transcript_69132/g.179649  ORF Transcript_69132/g.179649 Transcript_69132/m.179649 type:complete len:256 (-) Transcript_69132:56-823(-)
MAANWSTAAAVFVMTATNPNSQGGPDKELSSSFLSEEISSLNMSKSLSTTSRTSPEEMMMPKTSTGRSVKSGSSDMVPHASTGSARRSTSGRSARSGSSEMAAHASMGSAKRSTSDSSARDVKRSACATPADEVNQNDTEFLVRQAELSRGLVQARVNKRQQETSGALLLQDMVATLDFPEGKTTGQKDSTDVIFRSEADNATVQAVRQPRQHHVEENRMHGVQLEADSVKPICCFQMAWQAEDAHAGFRLKMSL